MDHPSFERYHDYISISSKKLLSSILSIFLFTIWLSDKIVRRRQGLIWVEEFIIEDPRFANLKRSISSHQKSESHRLIVFNRWSSPFTYAPRFDKSLIGLMKSKCIENLGAVYFWQVAIRLLKPKRIILLDDSEERTYSLVLAAQKSSVEVIGVSHGQMPPNQSFAYGFKSSNKLPKLRFNRYYVWSEIFASQLKLTGYVYPESDIFVCGWPQNNKYTNVNRLKKEKKYVLYAEEHFVANITASLDLLNKLASIHNCKMIIKRRPSGSSLPISDALYVDDFTKEHIEGAVCVVGCASTHIYELSAAGLMVVAPPLPKKYDFNMGMEIPFLNNKTKHFVKENLSSQFISEFLFP